MATLTDILPYTDLGWTVIPVRPGTKRPAVKSLRQWSDGPADRKVLWRWFRDGQNGVAVMLGDSSDGLCVRDFDADDAYRTWKAGAPVPREDAAYEPHGTWAARVLHVGCFRCRGRQPVWQPDRPV